MSTYNERLQQLFDNKGVTPYYLSRATGVSQATISRLKGDKTAKPNIETNKKFANYFNVSAEWLLTGEGNMLVSSNADVMNENTTYSVPLLPISAQGGSLNDFVVSVKNNECEKIISPIKGVDYAITVSGESMSPEYPSGSQVLIKKINERAFIDWGRVYVLDTCNGTVIKRLFPSDAAGCVVCKSINPEYPSFEVSMEDVYGVYRVLMCMSMK